MSLKKIGRFDIVRELGRGAQSVVYLGRDPQLDRQIAIKTLHFGGQDVEKNAALLTEARTVSRLRHPNIVPIFEAGEADGDPYLVFEYVPGKTLASVIKESGGLPPLRSAQLMSQVLGGIAHAHAQGIIHRDLKPSNILLDESGAVRVMDFGIASPVSARKEGEVEYSGTPAYMAPEYIDKRTVDPRTDVFAAGLVLYEMLAGKRAASGTDIYQVMYRLTHEDIALPHEVRAEIDERLADILFKALARNPESRFADAGAFRTALGEYLDSGGLPAGTGDKQSTLDFLLRRMRHKSDFPALSESVSSINKIAQSEKDSISKLSNTILRDVALTNKILRLVNSAFYRQSGAGGISTVSRAVLVLGFDAVRNLAITVLLFEHLQKSPGRSHLMEEFLKANLSGLLARELSKKRSGSHDTEQAFICALFHSLGRMLSQYYFPEETEEVRKLMQQKNISETAASAQVLGISFDDLGIGIARTWGFPDLIINCMRSLPEGHVRKPRTHDEALHVVADYANTLCASISGVAVEERSKALRQITARFHDSLPVSDNDMDALLSKGFEEVGQFVTVVHVNLSTMAIGKQIRAWSSKGVPGLAEETAAEIENDRMLATTVLRETLPYTGSDTDETLVGDAPPQVDVQAVLTAGIQDISNTLVEDFKLNDILRIILETMYRAMGFQRVILCIRDPRSNALVGRFGFGPDATELLRHFRIPLQGKPDVFIAASSRGVDILISDTEDEHIKARIPEWYRKAISARTFVVLPLNIKGRPVAMIYADREHAGEIVIPEQQLSLLRTLRNQAILAIKQAT